MTDIAADLTPYQNPSYQKLSWEGFAASGDVGLAYVTPESPEFSDRSVQVLGTFTGSLEITIEGSNDGGTTWATLHDPAGNTLVFTAAGLKAILELTEMIRAKATAGSGGGDADVHLFMKGTPQ
jgi:hypothetical protein